MASCSNQVKLPIDYSDLFVRYLKNKIQEELKIVFRYKYIQGILTVSDVEKNVTNDLEMVVVKSCLSGCIQLLSFQWDDKSGGTNELRTRVLFVSENEVDFPNFKILRRIMNFSFDDWNGGDNDVCKQLFEQIKIEIKSIMEDAVRKNTAYQSISSNLIFSNRIDDRKDACHGNYNREIEPKDGVAKCLMIWLTSIPPFNLLPRTQSDQSNFFIIAILMVWNFISSLSPWSKAKAVPNNAKGNAEKNGHLHPETRGRLRRKLIGYIMQLIARKLSHLWKNLISIFCFPVTLVFRHKANLCSCLTSSNKNFQRDSGSDVEVQTPKHLKAKKRSRVENHDKDFLNAEKFLPRPGGLKNTLETCYMNSMIQAMAASPVLIAAQKDLVKTVPSGEKLQMLTDVLNAINENKKSVVETTNMLKTFMHTVQWDRSSQQDAFQLLSFFINAIQKDLVKKTIPPKLKILHSFSENAEYNKIQDHLALAIPLCGDFREKSGVDLSKLLEAFFDKSEIDDGPHWTKLDLYGEAPSVMILHIQANEWSHELGQYVKPQYHINYGETLEYKFTIQIQKDGQGAKEVRVRYKLVAVVHHMGGVSGGHYITYRKLGEHWYLTNDEQVERVDFDCKITPYIMLYENTVRQDSEAL